MSSGNSSSEGDSSYSSESSSRSTSDSSSGSSSGSDSCSSSGSPRLSHSPSIRDVSLPVRPKAPYAVKAPPDFTPMGEAEEDMASSYWVEDLNENDMDEDELLDLTAGLGIDEAGPSRVGPGKGKSYETYLQQLKERQEQDEANKEGEAFVEGEEAYSASPERYAMEMPSPENDPYVPIVFPHEIDVDFEEGLKEAEKKLRRHNEGVISCAGLSSRISSEEIMWMMEYYNLEGRWLRPRSGMRMHRFDVRGLPVPRMVLTNKLVSLGLGSPMHPFLQSIINFYQIAPIQLSPNSYRMAIGIYMLYRDEGYDSPSMDELRYFLSLRQCPKDISFYYFCFWPSMNKWGFLFGNPNNMKS